jgi:hypothetical protein
MQNQSMPQPRVSLNDLTIDEANAIFSGLESNKNRITELVNKLVNQVNQQLNPAPAPSASAEPDASMAPGLSDAE